MVTEQSSRRRDQPEFVDGLAEDLEAVSPIGSLLDTATDPGTPRDPQELVVRAQLATFRAASEERAFLVAEDDRALDGDVDDEPWVPRHRHPHRAGVKDRHR